MTDPIMRADAELLRAAIRTILDMQPVQCGEYSYPPFVNGQNQQQEKIQRELRKTLDHIPDAAIVRASGVDIPWPAPLPYPATEAERAARDQRFADATRLASVPTPADHGASDDAAVDAMITAYFFGECVTEHTNYIGVRAILAAIRAGEVPGVYCGLLYDAQLQANAALRARVAELEKERDSLRAQLTVAECRADEDGVRHGEVIVELVTERDRALARVSFLETVIGNACGTNYKKTVDGLRAEVERLKAEIAALNEACSARDRLYDACSKERDALRAEVTALKVRKVKLPPYNTCTEVPNFADGFAHGRAAIIDAIRAAGIEVDP